jgi:YbgC/YbaW family acyl-CoA thioester hydrolase
MPRIKLQLPVQFSFSIKLPVRISDVNYGGHLGNDAVLSIIHEARMQFLQHHGYTEMELAGVSLIMSDVAIEFKAEAFYGEGLYISIAVADFTRVGFDLFYRITKKVAEKEVVVANCKTGMVFYDYATKKVMSVPDEVKTRFTRS